MKNRFYYETRKIHLFQEFTRGQVERFVRPAEPVAKQHLLTISARPQPLDDINVIIHVAFSSFDVHELTDVVRLLVETEFITCKNRHEMSK